MNRDSAVPGKATGNIGKADEGGAHEPILRPLLLLTLPSTVANLSQLLVNLMQIYYVGLLGTEQLAALALVSPLVLFMQFSSLGDVGGSLSAATARAQGGRRIDDLQRLSLYAVVISIACGVTFALIEHFFGERLYRVLGGRGVVLDNAVLYGHIVFGGIIFMWMSNLLAANFRGRGNVLVPSIIIVASCMSTLALYPALTFGFHGIPAFGIAGVALAFVANYLLSTVAFILYDQIDKRLIKIRPMREWWSPRLMQEIGRIGVTSSSRTVLSMASNLLTTFLVGRIGDVAIAGFGIASRLDFTLVSLLYGLGISLLFLVGADIGAGNVARAHRVAARGTLAAIAIGAAIGAVVSLRPGVWLNYFTTDAEVLLQGGEYLSIVGLVYGLNGCGSVILFVSQATGQMRWTFYGTAARFLILAAGAIVLPLDSIAKIAILVAGAYAVLGLINAVILYPRFWQSGARG